MTIFRIEVFDKNKTSNQKLVDIAHQLGVDSLTGCFVARVFFINGTLDQPSLQRLGRQLLADPVTENFIVIEEGEVQPEPTVEHDHFVDVTLLAGVTDTTAQNLRHAIRIMGVDGVRTVATGLIYYLKGDLSSDELQTLAVKVLSNPVIQRAAIDKQVAPPFINYPEAEHTVKNVKITSASDDELKALSETHRLSLNVDEMHSIQNHYQALEREPTDVELETLAQTWSEHCSHKTFRATITYQGPLPGALSDPAAQEIPGLLDTYLGRATREIGKEWVRSAFVDNAGIIAFDESYDLAFKVETHNHPSFIDPFSGANSGIGGVIRDVLGVSARPIANTDVLCFGPQEIPYGDVPGGISHPRRVQDDVIHGIEDYGNKMGIPTVNGVVFYDPGYTSNPLIYCGSVGILPHGSHRTEAQPDNLIVLLGGRTGRDGLRGATFSSMGKDGSSGDIAGSSVQIGHPINQKQLMEVMLQARDEVLYTAITGCGAGGLSSAVSEMGKAIGAAVHLDRVPLKYAGLQPWEIWLSESQERLVMAVAPDKWERLQAITRSHNIEVASIGTFTPTGRLTISYKGIVVGDLKMDFLHNGLPPRHMEARWQPPKFPEIEFKPVLGQEHYENTMLALLAHPNIRSKEGVVRRYDHEVQGGTALKPFVGVDEKGPSDGVVLVPRECQPAEATNQPGVALSNGICPQFGVIDPYAMAWAAIDEALRNIVAVGADPDHTALLDNFCWGNPSEPDQLGKLVRCLQGCYDAAKAYQAPFISGKDSLNNEYLDSSGNRYAIPGTLLVSALGIVPDINRSISMEFKRAGNRLYLVGTTRSEFGGSHYYRVNNIAGGAPPQAVDGARDIMRNLHSVMRDGLVQSCHDCSEGGLAVTLAEMVIASRRGATIELDTTDFGAETLLFAESLTRFVVEVKESDAEAFEQKMAGSPFWLLGSVEDTPRLMVQSGEETLLDMQIKTLELAWRGPAAEGRAPQPPAVQQRRMDLDRSPAMHTSLPKILILVANGTSRDHDAKLACQLAGGNPEIVHINQLISGERDLMDYHMLVIPGGFSYGDNLGAGVMWAHDFRFRLPQKIDDYIAGGRPVLGISNGFQALVKAGLLPGSRFNADMPRVTLANNQSGHFECRWVYLKRTPSSANLFTDELEGLIYAPAAHGEGRVAVENDTVLSDLWQAGLATLIYVDEDGMPVGYPGNPSGSVYGIAALGNPLGNVMGVMPHPENHIFPWQHPRWHRGESGMLGLQLFKNGIKYA